MLGDGDDLRDLGAMLEELLALVADGTISPMLSQTVSLDEVPAALSAMSRHEVRGKAVLVQP